MDAPFQSNLDEAMAPLLARAAKRVQRIQYLAAGPQTEATQKAIEAERREIELIQQFATRLGSIVTQMQRVITHNTRKCWELDLEGQYWKQRFNEAINAGSKHIPWSNPMPTLSGAQRPLRPLADFLAYSQQVRNARHAAHV